MQTRLLKTSDDPAAAPPVHTGPAPRLKGALRLYPALSHLLLPAVGWHLRRRAAKGKEHGGRLGERRGLAAAPRPDGPLIWVHAASIGEALSVLALIERLLAEAAGMHVLVTTGTVTSADILAERLPSRARHHFVPLDHPRFVARFLDHWRPDLALWVESEFWPNLLRGTAARRIPTVLVNARISERSFRGWSRFPRSIEGLLGHFTRCLAPDEATAQRLTALGARHVSVTGHLKLCAPPLPADPTRLRDLRAAVDGRPVWLAASIHGEDEAILTAHRIAAASHADALTIAVPRQPDQGPALVAGAERLGIRAALRSRDGLPTGDTGLYVADTIGELGLFYRLARAAFLGRSLSPMGGSNPLEPARLDCPILHGPHTENFDALYRSLQGAGASHPVAGGAELGERIALLLSSPDLCRTMAEAARNQAQAADGILDRVMEALAPSLPAVVSGARAP
ncbi:MAG: 3-deoxy-D-manno-octulosonic acid transferase [Alphaproteobacteria bacterium]